MVSHIFPVCLHWWIGSCIIGFRLKSLIWTANRKRIKKKSAAIFDTRGPDSGCVLLKINRKCFVFPSGQVLWILWSATVSPIHVPRCACVCFCVCGKEIWTKQMMKQANKTSRNLIFTTACLQAGRPLIRQPAVWRVDVWSSGKVLHLDWTSSQFFSVCQMGLVSTPHSHSDVVKSV